MFSFQSPQTVVLCSSLCLHSFGGLHIAEDIERVLEVLFLRNLQLLDVISPSTLFFSSALCHGVKISHISSEPKRVMSLLYSKTNWTLDVENWNFLHATYLKRTVVVIFPSLGGSVSRTPSFQRTTLRIFKSSIFHTKCIFPSHLDSFRCSFSPLSFHERQKFGTIHSEVLKEIEISKI